MYDETIEVKNPVEIESEEEDQPKEMASGRPPGRREIQNKFELSDSESDEEPERFINDLAPQRNSPDKSQNITRMIEKKPPPPSRQLSKDSKSATSKLSPNIIDSSDNSDSDSNDLDEIGGGGQMRNRGTSGVVIPAEGAYDPQKYSNLKTTPEIEELFQYIMRYTPQKIEIDYKLQPFIPDYIPAVGDIDPFIKIITPKCNLEGEQLNQETLDKIDQLGLVVLDEPSAEQSDPALLYLQLRAASKSSSAKKNMVVKKITDADNNTKAIDRWIKDISELHLSKPAPNVHYSKDMPDIDTLMQEWPETMETKLNEVGFPPANINCSLSQYVDIICNLFDIPVHPELGLNGKIQALHVLFTLYSEVRNTQLFKDQQREEKDNLIEN